jgi:hypothetical protein
MRKRERKIDIEQLLREADRKRYSTLEGKDHHSWGDHPWQWPLVHNCVTPYRCDYRTPDEKFPALPTDLKRSVKRPFIIPLGCEIQRTNTATCSHHSGMILPILKREWYHGLGCMVFDGLCANQSDFSKIDCAACIKSTFESFIKGCDHAETYVDQYGTRRCVACKDELGQDEPDDMPEEDDFLEDCDPREEDIPEDILNSYNPNYRTWNLEGRFDQREEAGHEAK